MWCVTHLAWPAGMQEISGNSAMRCLNCPTKGCFNCPMFGVGLNPEYQKVRRQLQGGCRGQRWDR